MEKLKEKSKYIIVAILIIIIAISSISIGGKVRKIASENNRQKAKAYSSTEPYVPDGFTHIDGTTSQNGYVIQEISTGNEFVWIPVDGTNIKLEKRDFAVTDISKDNCRETANPLFEESVTLYGGFYIARYESGIPEGTEYTGEEKNVSGKPVSKKSQEVWNYINYENAETSANQMYSESTEVTSSLMSGQAYDTVLTWLEQNGYNVSADSHAWGNYSNNEHTNNEVAKTGYENWVANNIYDLAGNVAEWTTEQNGSAMVRRGGNYSNEGNVCPAGIREKMSKTQYNNTTGFRVMLYKTGEVTIDGYDDPYIPSGFEHIEGEGTWDTGYVIRDTNNGNEFVWIPVDGRTVKIQRKDFGSNFASKDKAVDRLDIQFKISVNTNGGFYIARYEAGQGTSSNGNTLQGNVDGKPVSKKGVETWTNISQAQATKNAKKMYSSHTDMQSTLLSSYALDMTLQWLENSGINVGSNSSNWGNYSTNDTKSSKALTGSNDAYKANNIYDLAGNVWELTTEKYNNGADIIARGGDYLSTGEALPAASRDIAKNSDEYDYMGYRPILYKTTKVQGVEVPEEWDASKVYAIEDEDGNTLPIPNGFYYVKGTKNTGLVISDNKEDENKSDVESNELQGNQFVWVPVDNINYFTRRAFGDTNVDVNATEEVNNKYWENVPEDLRASVARYKGFYIARYEASYESGTTADDYIPASKASTSVNTANTKGNLWNNVTFDNAKAASENMYKSWNNINSTLTYGSQWDTMLQWFIDSGEKTTDEVMINSTSWGNYRNSTVIGNDGTTIKNVNNRTLLNTGITDYAIANNIYDIAGNLNEFTMEKYSSNFPCVLRGSDYGNYTEKVIYRSGYTNNIAIVSNGFRPSLYISMDTEEITITPDVTTPRNTTFTGDNNGVPAGPITVTITFGESDLVNNDKYQYKIGTDGDWKTSSNRIKTIPVKENCTIYARYYTGQAGFQTKSYTISNVDNDNPVEFEINTMNATEIGLVVEAESADASSDIAYYKYYLNDATYQVAKNNHKKFYTITNVQPGTKYAVRVEAYDQAGNKVSSTNTKEITTWTPTTYKWDSENQVNEPELTEGMIPIKWNGTNWVTTTAEDEEWYNYKENTGEDDSKWANVMLSDGTYKYDTVASGTVVQEEELGSMFVWLPRYAYKIESGYHTDTEGEISIEFLEGTSSHKTGVDIGSYPEYNYSTTPSESKMLNYVVHPAFNYDETQLTGLWVAKFMASREDATNSNQGTSEKFKILGNKYGYYNKTVGQYYSLSVGMNDEGNSYKLNSNDNIVDPHLMKNSEWGATAYLTHSKYGANRKALRWYYSTNNTGTGNYGTNINASSTMNIYGIYDLSMYNVYQYVSAYVNNGNNNITIYASELLNAPSKHKDVYNVGTTGNLLSNSISDTVKDNYESSKYKYGDAIYETSSSSANSGAWQNGRIFNMPHSNYPFFGKGKSGSNGSMFSMSELSGTTGSNSFRPTIAVIDEKPSENIVINADVTTPRNTIVTENNNGVPAGPITVTINYGDTDLQKQYKEGVEGDWITVNENVKQLNNIKSNKTIYARYYDGQKGMKTKSYTIANVDNIKPENFTSYNNYIQGTGIEISGYTTDNLTEKVTYKYYIDGSLVGTSKEKNYTTSIDTSKQHTTYIVAIDEAGNITKSTESKVSSGITQNHKWNSINQVNEPELTEGMIPIKWNGENWVTTTLEDEEWYNYKENTGDDDSKWANVMLSDGTYKYDTVASGTVVQEEELGSMFVWLPRYAYKIESGYHTDTEGEISIEFLEGTSSHKTGVDIGSYPEYNYSTTPSESKMLNYVVHPAFNYDETQLTGLWVAKFRASREDATRDSQGSSEKFKILGNKYAYNYKTVGQYYSLSIGMNDEGNDYKLNSNDNIVDPHLMKNSEWGATVYLTHSKYGVNRKDIQMSDYRTGIYYATDVYTKKINNASTMNISGVYDLYTGSNYYQYMAAYVNNGHTNLTTYASELLNAPNKHKDVYKVGTTGNLLSNSISDTLSDNYQANKDKYGDAIYETSNNISSVSGSWKKRKCILS